MSPGLGSNINRFSHMAKIFADNDYISVGYDHRGFGNSEGMKAYIDSYETLVNDYLRFMELIDTIYDKNIPRFFMG